ncbi:MAG: ATP-binding cassette domain-containing protein [Clostridiales bacterium]|jgi:putative ABC transport system ATP-binding protein|nr:ATP-binding cassette domain-containing protein [Clostridiales bacterium]
MSELIKVASLTKEYVYKGGSTSVFNNLDIRVGFGSFVGVVGVSGCGKSSFLKILAGLDLGFKGEYFLNNINISTLTNKKLASFRNEVIGYIPQEILLINDMSIADNILLPAKYAGLKKSPNDYLWFLAERLGIKTLLHKKPTELSGGERQRASIARALINRPKLIVADEPTTSVDDQNIEIIMKLFREICVDGGSVITATHDANVSSRCDIVLDFKNIK